MTTPADLYQQLISLCAQNDAFSYKDYPASDQTKFRIFNYRLTTYSDFLNPGALECRGSMFEVKNDGEFVRIASRTPKKFFNYGENPMTLGLDLSNPALVMKKEDGSLMSTYIDCNGSLKLKSKGSISSTQCIDATAYLDTQPALANDLAFLAVRGFTVNLEWTSPLNRIVVGYEKPSLTCLSVIRNETGDVHGLDFIEFHNCSAASEAWVKDFEYEGNLLEVVKGLVGEEGVVCVTSSGVTCKIKSDWYIHLHHTKESLDNPKSLISLILSEQIDDLKCLIAGDKDAESRIDAYEQYVTSLFRSAMKNVEDFHSENALLSRKEYAMKAKEFWSADEGFGFSSQMLRMAGRDFENTIKTQIIKRSSDIKEAVEQQKYYKGVFCIDKSTSGCLTEEIGEVVTKDDTRYRDYRS